MRATARRTAGGPEVYTALNANDFHPIDQAQGIDLLVRAQGGGSQKAAEPATAKRTAVKRTGAAGAAAKGARAKRATAKKTQAKRSGRKRK